SLREYGFEPSSERHPQVNVVHCGFRIERFNAPRDMDRCSVLEEFGFPRDAKVILFAGRLDRALGVNHASNRKNSCFAALMARAAVDLDPSVRLLMAGAGAGPRAEMERRIADWGLADKLRLIGVRADIDRLMRAADVLLFPSLQEGLGIVAVEAQAAGLPVLT